MKNACIPLVEQQRLNEKMKFQSQHASLLSKPRSITDKFINPTHSLDTGRQFKEVSLMDKRLAASVGGYGGKSYSKM